MPVRMLKKEKKPAGFSSTSQKGNILHGKLKSNKEVKDIMKSDDYKKSDYEGKTKMLNVATASKGLASRTHGSDKPNKEIGKQSFKKKFSFSGKQMSDHYKARKSRTQSASRMNPVPYLTGGQAKIAAKAPPPNKIDAKDFAVLRAEKAKGRGMGLQDEKVKPGKVMKARVGKSITKKIPLAGKATSVGSTTMKGMKFSDKAKMVDAGKINRATGKFTSMEAVRESVGYKPGESTSEFKKRRMKLEGAAKALKATRVGKILLPIVGAGVAAKTYLNSKMNKKKDVKKKMGGGMMQKPMGYSEGMGRAGARSKKKKLDIEAIVNSKQKFKGPKSTEGSLGNYVNNMRSSKDYYNAQSKMGGGMMQKPMGYNTGGFKSKQDRKKAEKNIKEARSKEGLRSFLSSGNKVNQPMRRERYMEGRKARHTEFKKKLGKTALGIASSLNPVTSIARGIGKVMGKGSKKRDFQKGDYGDISVKKNMGGMMMQRPMGYKSGTSVKVKCKLGRNKPTKIT